MTEGGWDWQRVDWKTYSQALNDVQTDLEDAEKQVNQMARNSEVPDDVLEAMSSVTQALTNLAFLVALHHQHIEELEAPG